MSRLGGAQIFGQRAIVIEPRLGIGCLTVELGGESGCGHPAAPISSRPISIRLISFVPAPISSSLASRM